MSDRTVNIIAITKHYGDLDTVKKEIANYMSKECLTAAETYTDWILYSIIKEAYLDYLHYAAQNRAVACVRELLETSFADKLIDRMLRALQSIRVAERREDGYHYIDSWHETKFTKELEKEIHS